MFKLYPTGFHCTFFVKDNNGRFYLALVFCNINPVIPLKKKIT